MKKLLFYIVLLLVLSSSVKADPVYGTLAEFMVGVRYQTKITSTVALPDSILIEYSARAILHTSTVVGGIEATFKINLVDEEPFYLLPDTIVEVLSVTLISGVRTKSLFPYEPASTGNMADSIEFIELTTGDDTKPRAYNIWNDSIQLIPIPTGTDSIYLKCYVEHPVLTAGANSIVLRADYIEAALFYASYLVLVHLGMQEEALVYKNDFNEISALLISKYRFRNIRATQ